MALDSSGNQAIDFVWGALPLQPNTERGGEAIVTYTVVDADEKGGLQRFTLSAEPAVGTEFEVVINPSWVGGGSGGSSAGLAGTYTVLSTELSPAGFYVKTTAPYINTAFGNVNMPLGTATVDPAKNFGGGVGDYGWSKTTKKKSALLDPTLDNHTLATSKWNGYPGYVPNVTSTSLWEGTIPAYSQVGMNWNGALLTFEAAEFWSGGVTSGQQGYTLRLAAPVDDTTIDTLSALVANDELIGKTVDAFTAHLDYMGMTAAVDLPAGWIVAAATVDDYYGQTHVVLSVYTDDLVGLPTGVGSPLTYTSSTQTIPFVVGAGENKSIVFKGTNDTDFESLYAYASGSEYKIEMSSVSWSPDVTPLSQALQDVAQSNVSGALIGFAPTLSLYGGNIAGQQVAGSYSAYKLSSANLIANDGYGNPKALFTTDLVVPAENMGMSNVVIEEYDPSMGSPLWTVYIVK